MKRLSLILSLLCLHSTFGGSPASLGAKDMLPPNGRPNGVRWPLIFEENKGQFAPEVKFISRSTASQFFLTETEAIAIFRAKEAGETGSLRFKLAGAQQPRSVQGRSERETKVNYLRGNDRTKWIPNTPTFGRVNFEKVYPGIDLTYYGNEQELEYDFIVRPGADPKQIALQIEGAERIEIDREGNLVLHTSAGAFRQARPISYQEIDGTRREVASHYVLKNSTTVEFALGDYDPAHELVIDPIMTFFTQLEGTTSIGGAPETIQSVQGMAVDPQGNVYVSGIADAGGFPVVNPLRATRAGGIRDSFIAKFNAQGDLLFSTYFGGTNGSNDTHSLVLDQAGNIYVSGWTSSTDFPTTSNAVDNTKVGSSADAFLTKLSNDGSTILYSTFYGGAYDDFCYALDVDSNGHAYLTGYTYSPDLPVTPNRFQQAFATGNPNYDNREAFLAEIDTAPATCSPDSAQFLNCRESLVYGTLLGTENRDEAYAVRVAAPGQVWIGGMTYSSSFPTKNAYQPTLTGEGNGTASGFIAKLDTHAPTGTTNSAQNINNAESLLSSTFFGDGGGYLEVLDIVLDQSANVIVSGGTVKRPGPFPLVNAFDADGGPILTSLGYPSIKPEGFVAKFNPTCTSLIFSSYLGGSESEIEDNYALNGPHIGDGGLAVDGSGNIYVTGTTHSSDFPILNPLPNGSSSSGGYTGKDAFIVMLSPTGNGLVSSYLAGTDDEQAAAVAIDPSRAAGTIYVAGISASSDIATVPPHPAKIKPKSYTAYVTRLALQESADTIRPTAAITSPAHNSGSKFTELKGTASDDLNGHGILVVGLTIFHEGKYWDGTAWVTEQTSLPTALGFGSSWSYSSLPTGNNLQPGTYAVSATAYDMAGNASQPVSGVNNIIFTVDFTPPNVAIVSPENGATVTQQIFQFNGTASDNAGIARVITFIRRNADGTYWRADGTGWTTDPLEGNLETTVNSQTGEWNCIANRPVPGYPPRNMPNGSYNFIAIAVDSAGNQKQTDSQITVDFHRVMTWNGDVSGDWNNAANWTSTELGAGLVVPDENAIVVLSNGRTISTNQSRTVHSIRLLDGRIEFTSANSRTLTTLRNSIWSGGSFGGIWNVAGGATLELIGDRVKFLSDNAVMNNFGRIIWGGPGSIQAEGNGYDGTPNAIINNKAGGIFQATAGGTLFSRASGRSGTPVFNNEAGAKFMKIEPTLVPGVTGTNFIQNADAEAGPGANSFSSTAPLPGWTTTPNFTPCRYSIGGADDLNDADAAAINGGLNYFTGGPETASSTASQVIDISSLADQIDSNNLVATIGGMFGGFLNQNDRLTASAIFRDADGVELATVSAGGVTASDRANETKLIPRSTNSRIPIGTRSVLIRLTGVRTDGVYCDGFADNLKFEITGTNLGTGPLVVDTFEFNNSGEMQCDAGAIAFVTTARFVNAGSLSGAGRFEVQGGTFNLTGNLALEESTFRVDVGDFVGVNATSTIVTVGNAKFEARGGRYFGQITNSEGSKLHFVDPEVGPTNKFFGDGMVLNNYGIATWFGGGKMMAQGDGYDGTPNAVFNNKSTGRFEFAADGTPFARGSYRSGDPVFNNEAGAQFKKTGGSGTLTLDTFFINNAGNMSCGSGLISWNTVFTWNNAATLQGPGAYEQKTGRLYLTGPLGVANNSLFTILGGEVYSQVGSGVNFVSPANKFKIRGGVFFGHFVVPAGSYVQFGDAPGGAVLRRFIDGAVLDNFGTVTWLGGAPIDVQGDGYDGTPNPVFNNKSGGRFEVAADGTLFSRASGRSGTPVFNNEAGATFVKTDGAGAALINVFNFVNRGNLICDTGVFRFDTGFDFTTASALAGAGGFEFNGGTLFLNGPLSAGESTLTINGGIIEANGNGTATLNSAGGKFVLKGGEFRGKLTLSAGSRLDFADPASGSTDKFFRDGSVFDNYGTVVWAGGGKILAEGNGYDGTPNFIFNNKPGGRFQVGADGEPFGRASYRSGTPTFNNEAGAVIHRYSGVFYTDITIFKINNYGQLSTQIGGFRFKTDVLFSNASPLIGGGCYYEMVNGRLDIVGELNTGNSTFTIIGDNTFAGANAAFVSPAAGRLRLHGGAYFGTFKVPAGSFLDFGNEPGLNNVKFFGDGSVIDNQGTIAWNGPGTIQAEGNGYNGTPNLILNNKSGAKFQVNANGPVFSRASYRSGDPVFNNETGALLRKTATGDSLFDNFVLVNGGQVVCDVGTLTFNTNIDLNAGSSFAGTGAHVINNGIVNLNANATTSSPLSLLNPDVRGNNASATFSTTGAGVVRWLGGIFRGSIGLTSNSRMDIADRPDESSVKFMVDATVLNNNGTVNWSGNGPIQGEGNGFSGTPNPIINNNAGATFNAVPTAGIFNRASYRSGAPEFNNAGTLNIGSSPGIMKFEGWNFAQTSTGRLNIELGGTNAATPQFDQLQVNGFATLGGTLVVDLINNFRPAPADVFDVITYTGHGGEFAKVQTLGSILDVAYGASSVHLTAKAFPQDNLEWKQYFFGDPSLPEAQPLADPNGNGIPNALEYALGRNPRSPGGSPISLSTTSLAARDETDSVTIDGVRYMSFKYTRPAGAAALSDVTYVPQRAAILPNPTWSTEMVEHSALFDPQTSLETVTVRSTHPMSESNREFLRLKVTITP